jgi:hypothetical protein
MSQEAAFELACERTNGGRLELGPVLYINGERRRSNPTESICDLREEALDAQQWWLVEPPGLRERYVVFDFEDGKVARIRIMWRGWDP